MELQMTGVVKIITPTASLTSKDGNKTFTRRELVLDCTRFNPNTGEPYPNFPTFEFGGNNCTMLDGFQTGQRVTVSFSLEGREYQDRNTGATKYFNGVRGYKVELAQPQPAPQEQQSAQQYQPNDGLPY